MNRYERAEIRRHVRAYALAYLGVRRLPNGVPAILDAAVSGMERWPERDPLTGTDGLTGALRQRLAPYRRWENVL